MVRVCDSVQGNWTQLRYEWQEGERAIEIFMPVIYSSALKTKNKAKPDWGCLKKLPNVDFWDSTLGASEHNLSFVCLYTSEKYTVFVQHNIYFDYYH